MVHSRLCGCSEQRLYLAFASLGVRSHSSLRTVAAGTRPQYQPIPSSRPAWRLSKLACRRYSVTHPGCASRLGTRCCAVVRQEAASQRAVLVGLEAADFRHPLDALATRQMDFLTRITGLGALIRRVIGPVAEQVLEIENISSGVLVGPEQLPSLYALLTEACEILHIDVPDLYIRQNPIPNAYTLAINGQRPFIVLHSALLDMGLTASELQTVIAHELGHLKCEHGIWITTANLLLLALGQLGELGRSLATMLGRRIFSWLQAAELSCDRAALLVMQDPRLVISVLMKLSGGSATWASEMNPDAFLQQAARLDSVSRTRLGRQVRQRMQRSATHPLPVVRARELDRWAHSVEYQRLLAGGQRRASRDQMRKAEVVKRDPPAKSS
jgi:Zn-dependent protease with chaperone function